MDYNITYEPDNFRGFRDNNHLRNFLNMIFRTDIENRYGNSLTRGNMYFLRNDDGELEYYVSVSDVSQRVQLKRKVMAYLKDIPLMKLYQDIAYITPNICKSELYDVFCELTTETLPALWKEHCPFYGAADLFLENTIMMVLVVDQSLDGETLQHKIHRLYKI